MLRSLRRPTLILASLALITPLGFYSKRGYRGPAAHWVHDSLGGVFYEIFWCLVLALVLPRWKASTIGALVLAATCILEFLQLWHPPLLEWPRSFFIGRTILGSYFDWWDFPYYFAGSALGWAWLRLIARASGPAARDTL
jgi:hypothetical protein